jgi:hypothetical protein
MCKNNRMLNLFLKNHRSGYFYGFGFLLVATLGMLPFSVATYAQTNQSLKSCVALSKKLSDSWQRPVPCFCGKQLANLEITPPQGLQVEAVCGLSDSSGAWIDLTKQRVSLDKYDKQGNSPSGEIYLSGSITLNGTANMEPSNSGDLSFYKKCDDSKMTLFQRKFCDFKLGSDSDYAKFDAPKPVSSHPKCWRKKAKLRIVDPVVTISDADHAGTYPRDIDVLHSTKTIFYKCYE